MAQNDASPSRERQERDLLYACLRDLGDTPGTRERLERLLDRVLQHLGCGAGAIRVQGPDGSSRLTVSRGPGPEPVAGPRRTAPLRHGGLELGVIELAGPTNPDAADQRLLEAVADCAAGMIASGADDDALLERERRDALTGLANHARFWSRLEVEFRRAERHRHALGLVMLDVDDFKAYNDRLGHPAGDDALATVARILESSSRAHDVTARYGGEEFAVLLPETDGAGVLCFAEKIRRSVETACFGPGGSESLTVSVGVATSEGEVASPRELVALAEERLENAKGDGRNQVCSGLV